MKKRILALFVSVVSVFSILTFSACSETENPEPSVLETRKEYIADISKFKAVWEDEWQPPEWALDFEEKLRELPSKTGRVMAFGHRGDIEHYPENSIEAIISAVKMGADGVEIDCFYSKDGVIVLNHSDKLSDTTDWSRKYGKTVNGITLPKSNNISDWTYEQLMELNLRFGDGEYTTSGSTITTYKIATLEEAMTVCRERCFLSLDKLQSGGLSSPDWENVYALVKKTNAYRSILYLNVALTASDANALRDVVEAECGISGPTIFDRTGTHNCAIDWYKEFELTTDKEFSQFYSDLATEKGTYILSNRLTRLIDWIDKNYKS